MTARPHIRCAIYTRKSSEEGLDQEFNSLDAQHEACAAYIASQRHEGWRQVAERYDDGGLSGGTLERPALQRLLANIDAGRISMVVVYKIDRLTRSLADFAKLVERLEAAGCSFVSVTQAFNTSSSMGRLTLNVLLSFAQFEREVTAERIRDKIAASKKKGLWMGGTVPLGYDRHPDPQRRELVVNPGEAEVVRELFGLYLAHRCLRKVETMAAERGLTSKRQVFSTGRVRGGGALSRGQIHYLLTNPTYLGRIRHGDKVYPGQHPAIVEQELFDDVQSALKEGAVRSRGRSEAKTEGPLPGQALLGKLRDETGERLTPSHAKRGERRLRYYVSNRLLRGAAEGEGWRLPAIALERSIASVLAEHLGAAAARHSLLTRPDLSADPRLKEAVEDVVRRLRKDDTSASLLAGLIGEGRIETGKIALKLDAAVLAGHLEVDAEDLSPDVLQADGAFQLRRRGVEARIIAGTPAAVPDLTLIRALAQAHRWAEAVRNGASVVAIATAEGLSDSHIRHRLPLALLSPKLQAAILEGRQPVDLTLERLVRRGIPTDWAKQEQSFGLAN